MSSQLVEAVDLGFSATESYDPALRVVGFVHDSRKLVLALIDECVWEVVLFREYPNPIAPGGFAFRQAGRVRLSHLGIYEFFTVLSTLIKI